MKPVTDTLKTLISQHGIEILQQEQRLKAMLGDILPHEKRMRYLLELSLRAGIPKKLSDIQQESTAERTIKINSLKHYFKEEYFLEDKAVESVFKCWIDVLVKNNIHCDTVTDIDGNVYKTIRIGNQVWMAENLRVGRYRNGETIPNIKENQKWINTKNGAWCHYDNDTKNNSIYGKLYNCYAVEDKRGLAPIGCHVATKEDFVELLGYFREQHIASRNSKSEEIQFWENQNIRTSNESGFSAIPGGCRFGIDCTFGYPGTFDCVVSFGYWWSCTEYVTANAWYPNPVIEFRGVKSSNYSKSSGYSVRCIMDSDIQLNETLDFDELDDSFEIISKDGFYGFVNSKGKMITPFKYTEAYPFSEKMALVKSNDKFGYINKSGTEIIPLQYTFALHFKDEVAAVMINDKYGFINQKGEVIIPLIYENAESFNENLACVKLNNKCGFIDKQGHNIISFKYDTASDFKESLSAVSQNNKAGYINTQGLEVISLKFDIAFSFYCGLALVYLNKKCGFIDKEGQEVIKFKYDTAFSFSNGLARVSINKKWGFINKDGIEIIQLKYDRVGRFKNGLSNVKLNNKNGFVDKTGIEYWESNQ